MLFDIFPSADTLSLGEKHSGTKLAVGLPLIAASHSSLSADVFLRSASGNISINTAGFLLPLIIAILKHHPVSLCLPEEDGTLRAYTFRLCNSLPSHNSPDKPATSGREM